MKSVLTPEMFHIGNRHYRKNPTRHALSSNLSVPVGILDESSYADEPLECAPDIVDDDLLQDVKATDSGFKCCLFIPPMFHKFFTGPNNAVMKNIERDFDCRILLPASHSGEYLISVSGPSQTNVVNACKRLKCIQSESRAICRPTHFVSLPAKQSEIKSSFEIFRESVLQMARVNKSEDFSGVDSSVFTSPSRLHFTIVTVVLAEEEIEMACKLLKTFIQTPEAKKIFSGGPLRLTIKGLDYMEDDPSAVHVLYAKAAESPDRARVQRIANALSNLFIENDLSVGEFFRPDNNVLLHMTLMNSIYRVRHSQSQISRKPFSVVGILREFGDFLFAEESLIDEIHLSIMGSSSNDGYPFCCQLKLNEKDNSSAPVDMIIP